MNKNQSALPIILSLGFLAIASFSYYLIAKPGSLPYTPDSESKLGKTVPKRVISQLANPATLNCQNKGGHPVTGNKRGDGVEFSLCTFDDNRSCEEWAMMRGECPEGGRKTTGYDNDAQRYCAWLGGETQAVKNAVCKLKNGQTCKVDDLYNGKCTPSEEGTKATEEKKPATEQTEVK